MAERLEYQSTHSGPEIDQAVDIATLVVANPSGQPEEALTKINISNTIYSLASSGGSTVTMRDWSNVQEQQEEQQGEE